MIMNDIHPVTGISSQRSRRVVRVSDRIASLILFVQVILFVRFFVLLTGQSQQGMFARYIAGTDFLLQPFNHIVPVYQIGFFVLEPASALLILILTALLSLFSLFTDFVRLKKKEELELSLLNLQ